MPIALKILRKNSATAAPIAKPVRHAATNISVSSGSLRVSCSNSFVSSTAPNMIDETNKINDNVINALITVLIFISFVENPLSCFLLFLSTLLQYKDIAKAPVVLTAVVAMANEMAVISKYGNILNLLPAATHISATRIMPTNAITGNIPPRRRPRLFSRITARSHSIFFLFSKFFLAFSTAGRTSEVSFSILFSYFRKCSI